MDEAFMEAYKGYQNNLESLDFIQVLQSSARYFELDSLEIFLAKEIIRLYPNNAWADDARRTLKFIKFNTLLDNKEYEEAKAYANENLLEEVGDNLEDFKEFLEKAESRALFSDHFEKREFQKAFEIIQEFYPVYFADTLSTHPEFVMETFRIKYLFEQVGRDNLVENLSELEFKFPDWVEFEYDKDITKEAPNTMYQLAMESMYNNNIDRYKEIVEELYFNRKNKLYAWNSFFNEPHEIKLLEENPKLKNLIDRIEEDQKRMKDNVVAFLKEEGAWKDSWEETEE
ncbi:MAG: hypothetical protein BalsKO_26680 [Balneolaceae bacterium]